jgi:hypothetical protein
MPIRASLRWFYPIEGPQLSRQIRFGRARGRCETCSRRHGTKVLCLPDGRWFDRDENCWRDGHGNRCIPPWGAALDPLCVTRVILDTAHRTARHPISRACASGATCSTTGHTTWQRWLTYRMRWAIGDLFTGTYSAMVGARSKRAG